MYTLLAFVVETFIFSVGVGSRLWAASTVLLLSAPREVSRFLLFFRVRLPPPPLPAGGDSRGIRGGGGCEHGLGICMFITVGPMKKL